MAKTRPRAGTTRGAGRRRREAASPAKARSDGRLEIAVAAQPALFCEILSRQLGAEPDLAVVGQAGNEEGISEMLAGKSPRVLLLDYEGLGPNVEATVRRLRHDAPATRILVLATRSGDDTVESVLRAGASGLAGKQLEFSTLVRAIRTVASGEVWANRRVTSLALESLTSLPVKMRKSDLTEREDEIAEACARGMRNKDIARLLTISEKTVKGHLNNIFRKLQIDSRFALALKIAERIQPKS